MTYLFYKESRTYETKPIETLIKEWQHLSNKENWRITQLPNGYYQTEVCNIEDSEKWHDITRRETIEGAEAAIDGSIDHFTKKLDLAKGPKVVKSFKSE